MEGVTDAPMRTLLGERGGFSYCVSEFLRVSQDVPPARVFFEHIPELKNGARTPTGVPVQIQLLGGDAQKLAATARLACELGARAIDLNFGCPAPTVNRHDGGATLLKCPDRIREIVSAVRAAVPAQYPVSAKLRLGWDSMDSIDENAERAAEGGASWIAIHGRTRMQGYIPPAYWGPIGRVRKRLGIPVIANGEIWTMDDFRRCRDETESSHFMVGRGVLGDPDLPLKIAAELGLLSKSVVEERMGRKLDDQYRFADPRAWLDLLNRFTEISEPYSDGSKYTLHRIKQWLRYAKARHDIAWFDVVKRMQTLEEVLSALGNLDDRGSASPESMNHVGHEGVQIFGASAPRDPVAVHHHG